MPTVRCTQTTALSRLGRIEDKRASGQNLKFPTERGLHSKRVSFLENDDISHDGLRGEDDAIAFQSARPAAWASPLTGALGWDGSGLTATATPTG
jgi:hypothetical protein